MNSDRKNQVSVIITVLNDGDSIVALLNALVSQSRAPDEIVVIDGGSTDGTQNTLEAYDAGDVAFRWIEKPGVNIAAGRNIAIREARFDIIACTDAGCVPDSSWLEEIVAPLIDSDVQVVGGNYRIAARTSLERVVGMLTLPGALSPIDPMRFNPSARSLAFRRGAWERAGEFPDWLMTAEDTLFACKLRRDGEPFAFAEEAIVRWRPRRSWPAVWRQFRGYARGEAHIGRGISTVQYWRRRYRFAVALTLVATLALLFGAWWLTLLGCVVALGAMVAPIHHKVLDVARRTNRIGDYMRGIAMQHYVITAQLIGHAIGVRERDTDPRTYVGKLRAYFGSPIVTGVANWKIAKPATPRALVISWHWAPTNRASSGVLSNLFSTAPPGAFHVVTRGLIENERDPLDEPNLATTRIAWPRKGESEGTLGNWFASIATARRMIKAAEGLHREVAFQRVIAVYPHRFSLLAGWWIARRLRLPLAAYMHDLCAEALITRNPLKRAFWNFVDRQALSSAFLVATPTREFALHYRSRDALESWVLPHTHRETAPRPEAMQTRGDKLRLVYAGNVYQAHEDAIRALVSALNQNDLVEAEFLCRANKVIPREQARWVDRATAREKIASADVVVVALSGNSPYPRETQGCFPSKMIDYFAAGKPILAIVPPNSFVDRLVRTTGCGVSVTSEQPADIARVLHLLRDASARREMGEASRRIHDELGASRWMAAFCERLALGAPVNPSTPPFPHASIKSDASSDPAPVDATY